MAQYVFISECEADEWQCEDKQQCIKEDYTEQDGNKGRCDGEIDCDDKSDEDEATCRKS